jgi:hypothetical protein
MVSIRKTISSVGMTDNNPPAPFPQTHTYIHCFAIGDFLDWICVMEVIGKMALCPFGSNVYNNVMILVKVFLAAVL